MHDDTAPATPADGDAHPRARRARPRWRHLLWLALVVPFAWAILMLVGPFLFLLLATAVMVVDLFLDRHRSGERRADLRERRRRALERAIESGGPSDEPTARHRSPDPNAAERDLYGHRMPGIIRGAWPRGRI